MYPLSYKHYWAQAVAPVMEKDNFFKIYFWIETEVYLFTGEPASGSKYEVVKFTSSLT